MGRRWRLSRGPSAAGCGLPGYVTGTPPRRVRRGPPYVVLPDAVPAAVLDFFDACEWRNATGTTTVDLPNDQGLDRILTGWVMATAARHPWGVPVEHEP